MVRHSWQSDRQLRIAHGARSDAVELEGQEHGFFHAIIQGKKLGNFDLSYDGRAYEQLNAGQFNTRNGKSYFDTWTSFTGGSYRNAPPRPRRKKRFSATEWKRRSIHRSSCTASPASRFRATSRFAQRDPIRSVGADARDRSNRRWRCRGSLRARFGAHGLVQNSGNELLLVVPPQPLDPGSEHEVEIHHEGKVVLDAGHQVYFVSSRGTWYPNRGAQFATYDVTYRYPKNLDLVSAGQVKEDRTEDDVRITRRSSRRPHPDAGIQSRRI